MKRPTLKDVAREAGVSPTTVSRVMLGGEQHLGETRDRILAAARRIGYQPNSMARWMRGRKTGMVGVLVERGESRPGEDPSASHTPSGDNVLSRVLEGIETEFLERGYKVLLSSVTASEIQEQAMPSILGEGLVEGVVVLNVSSQEYLASLVAHGSKVVSVAMSNPAVSCVVADCESGGRIAADHFWSLGHRAVALISSIPRNSEHDRRMLGFIGRWRELLFDMNATVPTFGGDPWTDGGAVAFRECLKSGHRPSAIFCANDHLAIHAIQAIRSAGLTCPGDVSVMGFDGSEVGRFIDPPLTTIHTDKFKMGRVGASMLIDKLGDAGDLLAVENECIRIPVSLVARSSTRAVNPQSSPSREFHV
jgi:DNA-binding LacI/PurR family transcriptional regulator